MKRLFIIGCLAVLLAACSTTNDEPDMPPTTDEPVERYFTITNGDSEHTLIYMGGLSLAPTEVSQPITLLGDSSKYDYYWVVGERWVSDTLRVNMKGKPSGITINYTVKYE